MLLNCGVGEHSWDSLGQQDKTSPPWRKSVLNIHWTDWYWSWNSNPLATWCKELTRWKRPRFGKDWRQEEKGTAEDEMVGWYHWLDGHEFEQVLGVVMDQETFCATVHGVTKSRTWLRDWTDYKLFCSWYFFWMLADVLHLDFVWIIF